MILSIFVIYFLNEFISGANVAIQNQKVNISPPLPFLFYFYFLSLTAYISIPKEKRRKFHPSPLVKLQERERALGGGSLPLASAAYGVFRYPLCGALPRNAP
jgi:hypothetical protein